MHTSFNVQQTSLQKSIRLHKVKSLFMMYIGLFLTLYHIMLFACYYADQAKQRLKTLDSILHQDGCSELVCTSKTQCSYTSNCFACNNLFHEFDLYQWIIAGVIL